MINVSSKDDHKEIMKKTKPILFEGDKIDVNLPSERTSPTQNKKGSQKKEKVVSAGKVKRTFDENSPESPQ